MSDPVSMSLDDYIKSQRRTGSKQFRGRGRSRGGANSSFSGGRGGQQQRGGNNNNRRGKGQRYFRQGRGSGQRQVQSQGTSNVQRRRGNRGRFGGTNRGQRLAIAPRNLHLFTGNINTSGGNGQQKNRRSVKNRTPNNNRQLWQHNSTRGRNQGLSDRQVPSSRRYINSQMRPGAVQGNLARRPNRRIRNQNQEGITVAIGNRNTKRAFLKLAKKRVQRAKLLVSRRRVTTAATTSGSLKQMVAGNSGRVALGRNGFVTVRNAKAKRMEQALVQMKIARAQRTRGRQRNASLPGSSGSGIVGKRSVRRTATVSPQFSGWNTSAPIVRTMRNDMVDEMTSSELNPEIQRKIAFIQSRPKADRAPVMPDFKAPVTSSRMKLSDRFRLLRDQ